VVKKANEKHLNIGSSLAIDQILALKKKIEKEFKDKTSLVIGSDEIQSIDLAGIQLLQHFADRARQIGKELHIKLSINPDQRGMLEKNGFTNILETQFT
jgi:anti-anti-sigma regulatory factor